VGYSPQEFDEAFRKVQERYTFVSKSTAEAVLGHLEKAIRENDRKPSAEKRPFWELIRFSLNEASVTSVTERKPYKSLIGYIFGKHGNFVGTRQHYNPEHKPEVPRFPKTSPDTDITEMPNGQRVWKF
jgi:hypothetical protein